MGKTIKTIVTKNLFKINVQLGIKKADITNPLQYLPFVQNTG